MIGPDLIQQWSCPWTKLTTEKTVRAQLRSTERRPSSLFFGNRATIALARQPDERWLGMHSHMSLVPGLPQDSHGKRSVKAR